MTTSALIMIVLTQGTVITATIYFFRKVLKAPSNGASDSYSDNDVKKDWIILSCSLLMATD